MKTLPRSVVQIALTMAVLMFHSVSAYSDTVFVWSDDSTIKQFATNGIGSVLVTNSGGSGASISGWNGPVGLALDNEGNLYSGSPGTSRVMKYATNGIGSEVGFADSVSAVAFDRTGYIYMTCPNYVSLCKGYFTVNCTQSYLSYPTGLAFDSAGNIYVANGVYPFGTFGSSSNTIAKFSADLTYLEDFATGLNKPWGLAFDRVGNLYVSNSGTNGAWGNTIIKIKPNGDRSTFNTALNSPRGLAFDRAGNLYVANSGSGTILKFTPDGTGSVFASGLNSPTSIAIKPGLKLWPTSIALNNPTLLPDGAFQFTFDNAPGMSFSALVTTNVSLPLSNWTALGGVTEISPAQFQFTDPQATNDLQRFYRVRAN